MKNFNLPALGAGLGLRHEHFEEILEQQPPVRWFEIITEDFFEYGGYAREMLERIRAQYRIIPHGVCLSIGSTDPLDLDYLKRLKTFLDLLDPPWTSDHLCFTMVDHTNLNELIPLPFTKESADNVAERARRVQDYLERPLLLENVTRYITVSQREMNESEFINTVLDKGDCGLLLDITNVHLNAAFHGFDPLEFIQSLPLNRVGQVHLAGWEPDANGLVLDSHDAPVPPEVWQLFRATLDLMGPTSALIEWDNQLPPLSRLLEESVTAERLMREVCGDWAQSGAVSHAAP